MADHDYIRLLASAPVRYLNWASDIHVTPQDDWFDHSADLNCPCHPFQDPQNILDIRAKCASKYVWVHRQIKYNKLDHQ